VLSTPKFIVKTTIKAEKTEQDEGQKDEEQEQEKEEKDKEAKTGNNDKPLQIKQ
jgi:hypothetical protein